MGAHRPNSGSGKSYLKKNLATTLLLTGLLAVVVYLVAPTGRGDSPASSVLAEEYDDDAVGELAELAEEEKAAAKEAKAGARVEHNVVKGNIDEVEPTTDVEPLEHTTDEIIIHGENHVEPDVNKPSPDDEGALFKKKNILFMKGLKVAGSTAGGVVRRIAANHEIYGFDKDADEIDSYLTKHPDSGEPYLFANHGGLETLLARRSSNKLDTYMFAMAREPAARCLSSFYHKASRKTNAKTDDRSITKYLKKCKDELTKQYGGDEATAEDALVPFDFIGVVERFEESMLVLGHQIGATLSDILFVSAKESTSGQRYSTGHVMLPDIPPEQQTKKVQEFIKKTFQKKNKQDAILWARANSGLDAHVQSMGSPFQGLLAEYKKHLAEVAKICGVPPGTDGAAADVLNCYWNDNGCGYDCLDTYAQQQGLDGIYL